MSQGEKIDLGGKWNTISTIIFANIIILITSAGLFINSSRLLDIGAVKELPGNLESYSALSTIHEFTSRITSESRYSTILVDNAAYWRNYKNTLDILNDKLGRAKVGRYIFAECDGPGGLVFSPKEADDESALLRRLSHKLAGKLSGFYQESLKEGIVGKRTEELTLQQIKRIEAADPAVIALNSELSLMFSARHNRGENVICAAVDGSLALASTEFENYPRLSGPPFPIGDVEKAALELAEKGYKNSTIAQINAIYDQRSLKYKEKFAEFAKDHKVALKDWIPTVGESLLIHAYPYLSIFTISLNCYLLAYLLSIFSRYSCHLKIENSGAINAAVLPDVRTTSTSIISAIIFNSPAIVTLTLFCVKLRYLAALANMVKLPLNRLLGGGNLQGSWEVTTQWLSPNFAEIAGLVLVCVATLYANYLRGLVLIQGEAIVVPTQVRSGQA